MEHTLDPQPAHSNKSRKPNSEPAAPGVFGFAVESVSRTLQAKLTVGAVDDPYEKEADAVADAVVQVAPPPPAKPRTNIADRELIRRQPAPCGPCAAKEQEQGNTGGSCSQCSENEQLMRTPATPGTAPSIGAGRPSTTAVPAAIDSAIMRSVQGGAGRPLPMAAKSQLEPHFGHDFSQVRIHHDNQAATLADGVRARAFTLGNDIFFARGAFEPDSGAGRRLLAHELTHTIQQTGGSALNKHNGFPVPAPSTSPNNPPAPQVLHRVPQVSERIQRTPPESGGTGTAPASWYDTTTTGRRDHTPLAVGDQLTYRGWTLSEDADVIRHALEEQVREHGLDAMRSFVREFHSTMVAGPQGEIDRAREHAREYERYGGGDVSGAPQTEDMYTEQAARVAIAQRIESVLTDQAADVEGEIRQLFDTFTTEGANVIRSLLTESETRVRAEMLRYGLDRETETDYYDSIGGSTRSTTTTTYSMEGTVASSGLAGAAADLAGLKNTLLTLQRRQAALMHRHFDRRQGEEFEWISDQAEYDRLGTQITTAQRAYDVARASAEMRYPVLASFAEEGGTSSLERVARGTGGGAADVVGPIIYERLANIEEVRSGLGSGDVDPWKLPDIRTLTLAALGIPPGSMHARAITDEATERSDEGPLGWVLAGIAMILGLVAAGFTGGLSIPAAMTVAAGVGAAGISGYLLLEHLEQYHWQSAQAGTDFDRARAISSTSPSQFWLALDIAFFLLDVGAAAQAFRRLAPLAVRAAAEGAEAAEASARLTREATEVGGAPLATRISNNLAAMRGGGARATEVAGAAGRREAEAVAEAMARHVDDGAQIIAEAPSRFGGHNIRLAPDGTIIRCSSCEWIRGTYATELVREPELARQWFEIEEAARRAAASGDQAAIQRAATRARDLTDQLEAVRRTREVRLYRGRGLESVEDIYLMDRRLVVDMPYVGRGVSGTKPAGWLRDNEYYWREIARRHPEAFSPNNLARINGQINGTFMSPINDPTFYRAFPQYDVRGLRSQTLIHHHIGGGGQAAAIPAPLHPGSGGIHNVETAAGMTGGEDPVAEVLERLLQNTPAPP